MSIHENIKNLRKKKNVTQSELAEALYVSVQAVSRWENGECSPDIDLLVPIAEYFGVSTDHLLGRNPGDKEAFHDSIFRYIHNTDVKNEEWVHEILEICWEIQQNLQNRLFEKAFAWSDTYKAVYHKFDYMCNKEEDFRKVKKDQAFDMMNYHEYQIMSISANKHIPMFVAVDKRNHMLSDVIKPDPKYSEFFGILADESTFKAMITLYDRQLPVVTDKQGLIKYLDVSLDEIDKVVENLTKLRCLFPEEMPLDDGNVTLYYASSNNIHVPINLSIIPILALTWEYLFSGAYHQINPIRD